MLPNRNHKTLTDHCNCADSLCLLVALALKGFHAASMGQQHAFMPLIVVPTAGRRVLIEQKLRQLDLSHNKFTCAFKQ